MKTLQKITVLFLLVLPHMVDAATNEVPYNMDDRDRIIRTEQKVESLKIEMTARFAAVDQQFKSVDQQFKSVDQQFKSVDKRFDAMDKRFDQLFNFLWAIIGIFTAMMVSIFGFAFWDRKLSLAPLKKEDQRIIAVLVDFARTQPKLSEILKNAGLL
jgi:hypothetical protein